MIYDHDPQKDPPLFLFVAYQAPHWPIQNPPGGEERTAHIRSKYRRKFCGLKSHVDDGFAWILAALKAKWMYENCVRIRHSNNRGDVSTGASNFPYRGSKSTPWKGGTKVAAFLHSGSEELFPKAWRGSTSLTHGRVTDIFSTVLGLIGEIRAPRRRVLWTATTCGTPGRRARRARATRSSTIATHLGLVGTTQNPFGHYGQDPLGLDLAGVSGETYAERRQTSTVRSGSAAGS